MLYEVLFLTEDGSFDYMMHDYKSRSKKILIFANHQTQKRMRNGNVMGLSRTKHQQQTQILLILSEQKELISHVT